MTLWSWLFEVFASNAQSVLDCHEEQKRTIQNLRRGRSMFYIVLFLCWALSSLAMPVQHNLAPAYHTFSASLEPHFSIALNHPPNPIPSTPPHTSHPYPATLMPLRSFTKLILAQAQISTQSHFSELPSPTFPVYFRSPVLTCRALLSPSCHLAPSWLISYLWRILLKGSLLLLLGCKLHK